MRACAPPLSVFLWAFLSAFFFAQQAIAVDQTKTPAPTPLPNAVATPPAVSAPAQTQFDKPPVAYKPTAGKPTADKPSADKPTAGKPTADKPSADKPTAGKPTAGKLGDALTNLPASQRLAISVLAGVFTLIVALWIGARRD